MSSVKTDAPGQVSSNPSRFRLEQEVKAFARRIPKGARVLDAGAGESPYRGFFDHTRYETADICKLERGYAPITYVCDLTEIPVENDCFDFIIFTQVLEHTPTPCKVLEELFRTLKPGGKILYSGPFYYEEHEEPYDYYRFTQHGIRYLMEEAGFSLERLDWLEGYCGTASYQLEELSRNLPTGLGALAPGLLGILLAPLTSILRMVFRIASRLLSRAEMKKKYTAAGHPKNYVAVGVKGYDREETLKDPRSET